MTRKTTNNGKAEKDFYRLSIQISLNGLSFCMLDTVAKNIMSHEQLVFAKEVSPFQLADELQQLLEKHDIQKTAFSEVVVIHRNNLFSIVPKALFQVEDLPNYLKFNAKILATDHIAYDQIEGHELVNVYVPFVNINNYIYDLFGEFVFKHNGTVMMQSLLNERTNGKQPMCYVHAAEQQLDITVVQNKKLVFFNTFDFSTHEDFLYYVLFTIEQLKLDTDTVQLRLFGDIKEGDALYNLCYSYIKNVSIFIPSQDLDFISPSLKESIDFTVLNAL